VQFEIDSRGRFADIFLEIRDIVLSVDGIREQKSAKQTAYYSDYSAICFLRSNEHMLTLALAQGAKLQERYPFLEGDGKIVRHIYFYDGSVVDRELISAIIEESVILTLEQYELKRLKRRE